MKCALQIRKDASSGLGGVTHMHCIFLQGIGQVLYLLNAFDHLEQVVKSKAFHIGQLRAP